MKPYYEDKLVTIYQGDCAELLPHIQAVDLVLTDPPYGLGENRKRVMSRGTSSPNYKRQGVKDYGEFNWDTAVPLELLVRAVSHGRNAIVFGGNFYPLPHASCWLIWDKLMTGDFAPCEMAWTNLPGAVRRITHCWNGVQRLGNEERFHPTQKPLHVMSWCIRQADAKVKSPMASVLDPFMGSGTTLRAAKDLGRRAIGVELDERYCEIAAKRMRQEVLLTA